LKHAFFQYYAYYCPKLIRETKKLKCQAMILRTKIDAIRKPFCTFCCHEVFFNMLCALQRTNRIPLQEAILFIYSPITAQLLQKHTLIIDKNSFGLISRSTKVILSEAFCGLV
jgi:hypothetical protein